MSLPPISSIRTRYDEQWEIIAGNIDMTGKSVVDLGCGTGNMMLRALHAGASYCLGIDQDIGHAQYLLGGVPNCRLIKMDFNREDPPEVPVKMDVGIFFSVWPYLLWPKRVLRWMSLNVTDSLIEVQYTGDGPGKGINDDNEMARILLEFWDTARVIGKTAILDRNKYRTIWHVY